MSCLRKCEWLYWGLLHCGQPVGCGLLYPIILLQQLDQAEIASQDSLGVEMSDGNIESDQDLMPVGYEYASAVKNDQLLPPCALCGSGTDECHRDCELRNARMGVAAYLPRTGPSSSTWPLNADHTSSTASGSASSSSSPSSAIVTPHWTRPEVIAVDTEPESEEDLGGEQPMPYYHRDGKRPRRGRE